MIWAALALLLALALALLLDLKCAGPLAAGLRCCLLLPGTLPASLPGS